PDSMTGHSILPIYVPSPMMSLLCPSPTKTSRRRSKNFHPGCWPFGTLFDVPGKLARRKQLEDKMGQGGFWDNQETAKPVIAEMKVIKAQVEPIQNILREIDDVRAMYELGEEAGESATIEEADRALT